MTAIAPATQWPGLVPLAPGKRRLLWRKWIRSRGLKPGRAHRGWRDLYRISGSARERRGLQFRGDGEDLSNSPGNGISDAPRWCPRVSRGSLPAFHRRNMRLVRHRLCVAVQIFQLGLRCDPRRAAPVVGGPLSWPSHFRRRLVAGLARSRGRALLSGGVRRSLCGCGCGRRGAFPGARRAPAVPRGSTAEWDQRGAPASARRKRRHAAGTARHPRISDRPRTTTAWGAEFVLVTNESLLRRPASEIIGAFKEALA